MDWLSNGLNSALSVNNSSGDEESFTSRLSAASSSFTPTLPSMSMFSGVLPADLGVPTSPTASNENPKPNQPVNHPKEEKGKEEEKKESLEKKVESVSSPTGSTVSQGISLDDDEVGNVTENVSPESQYQPRTTPVDSRRSSTSAGDMFSNTIGTVQNLLHSTGLDGHHGHDGRRSSTFGEHALRPGAFHKQKTMVDLTTGTKMKRKKIQHVNIVPESLRVSYFLLWFVFLCVNSFSMLTGTSFVLECQRFL